MSEVTILCPEHDTVLADKGDNLVCPDCGKTWHKATLAPEMLQAARELRLLAASHAG